MNDFKCPQCGIIARDHYFVVDGEEFRTVEAASAYVRSLGGDLLLLRCQYCMGVIWTRENGWGKVSIQALAKYAKSALRKTYMREAQLQSSDGWLHYGITHSLKERGYSVPSDFRGTTDDLAFAIGMSHAELAEVWDTTEDDLRQRGEFIISK